MWDRLRTASPLSAMTAPDEALQGRHPRGGVHKQHTVTQKRVQLVRPGRTHHRPRLDDDDDFPEPLDPLGISHNTSSPNRFAIQRGKVVPRYHNVDIILPSHNGAGYLHPDIVPLRRSSQRRQRHQHQASLPLQSSPAWRPASSVYANSDEESSTLSPQYKLESSTGKGGLAAIQISPPSSPDIHATQDMFSAGDVSPIDDDLDQVQRLPPYNGSTHDAHNLPFQQQEGGISKSSRGAQRHDKGALNQPRELRSSGGRAWNEQVHMGRVLTPPDGDTVRDTRPRVLFSDSNKAPVPLEDHHKNAPSHAHGQHMRPLAKAKPEQFDNRPPWKGASGRSVIVEPIHDDLNAAPMGLPRKSSKRPSRNGGPAAAPTASATPEYGNPVSAMRKFFPLSSKHRNRKSTSLSVQPPMKGEPLTAENPYPSPLYTDFPAPEPRTHDAPPSNWYNEALASHPPKPLPSPVNAIKRKPHPPSAQPGSASSSLALDVKSSDGAVNSAAPVPQPSTCPDDTWVPPPSRFSITTYATSGPGTPRQSADEDTPPLPEMPLGASLMNSIRLIAGDRNRVIGSGDPAATATSSPYPVVRPPQNRSDSYDAKDHRHKSISDVKSAERRASILSMSKPLPPAPPEMSLSHDPVSHLNAQLHSLAHRRVNIEKSIKQMTELMPQDNLLASEQVLRKREEEKQKVDGLRQELAEIQSQEHKLGLQLFRAYKRQDKEAAYEPTTLWVRRVAA
ncbi:hypothetical protein ED733_000744 [Metarhizium rileyi]|uniref:Uncharacterized protein n=1 Tax=Metarhizium rileyi (strain RCEF 4871) TaxID=1649241 RepID=A0A5C6GIQ4_METRR|nr:hypothetical protein ED733_000744 [Metarhizium rileyi]